MSRSGPTVEFLDAASAEVRQRRAAGALLSRGCRPGDRVAFALGSSADLICAVLGAARVGLIPVLLNATLTTAERDLLAEDAEPAVRVFSPSELTALGDGVPAELAPYPLTRPMHYTSGTTGRPKGVTTGMWDEATARAVFEDEASVWQFDARDLHMVCSPMYHTVSIRFSTGTLLSGGSLAILSRFDAGTALEVLRQHRPTTAFLVPTHLQRILLHPDLAEGETFDSLRFLAHAGAPCPEPVKRASMLRVRRGALWEFYGSTEAQFTVCSPEEWLENPGSVGRARPGRRLSVVPLGDPDSRERPTPSGQVDGRDLDGADVDGAERGGRHDLVRPPRIRPLQLLARSRGDRGGLAGERLLGRGPRTRQPRRVPLPHGPASRPHHQRRCQRVSG